MPDKSKTPGRAAPGGEDQLHEAASAGYVPLFTVDAAGDAVLLAVLVAPTSAGEQRPSVFELPPGPGVRAVFDEHLFDLIGGIWPVGSTVHRHDPGPAEFPHIYVSWASAAAADPSAAGPEQARSEQPLRDLDAVRARLVRELTPPLEEIDPVPHAVVEQARRLAALQTELLSSGAYTKDALAEGWGVAPGTAAKRVERYRARHLLFTVTHSGETLVPAFLLDAHMQLRPELEAPIRALTAVGEGGFALWAWFVTPSGWLDGAIPEQVAATDPDLVATAAERRASNAA